MEAACIRHTRLPGTSKLFGDFLYHFDRVQHFYPLAPFELESYIAAARQVSLPASRRADLVSALTRLNPGSPLLAELAKPETVAVVTGQQVGVYGGPCYTIFKALTAVHIAEHLTKAGYNAVPLFWIATEDHDFAEIDHAWTFDGSHMPVRLTATGNGAAQQPVGGIAMADVPAGALRAAIEGMPFGPQVLEIAERAYAPGRSFGEAFRMLVGELLGKHRVLFVDPLEPSLREVARPFLADAAAAASRLASRLTARNQELANAGYHAQVLFEGDASSLFFQLDGGRRVSLKKRNPADVADATQLSPNALLRPVMQDYLLPTAVMVGGPAEIAYLAQSAVLYEELGIPRPAAVPRSAFTLLDARVSKLLDRYGLTLPDVLDKEDAVRARIARQLVPPSVGQAFDKARASTEAALEGLQAELQGFDPSLADALIRSRSKIAYQIEKTRRKIERETLRRKDRENGDTAYLIHHLYPNRHLQERYYSILPFLAMHGLDLVDRVYENIHLNCADHQLLPV